MTDAPLHFSSLAEAIEPTFVRRAEHFESLPSTNDRALEIAASVPASSMPLLILADRQTAGRGRGRNRWFANEGVLTCSLLIEPGRWGLGRAIWPRLSVAVGGAVTQALVQWSTADRPLLKWPNDVLIRDRKVCGILIETSPAAPDRLVIGVGINVASSFDAAPRDVAARSISLHETSPDAAPERYAVLHAVLTQLDRDFHLLADHSPELVARWRQACALTGRMIAITEVDRVVSGVCAGLEDDASLLIRTEFGPQRCYAGTVTLVDQ